MLLCTICALEHLCRIFRTSVRCPFVHKRLTNISDDRLLSVCAWVADRSERKGKEISMKIKKITLQENASNHHKKEIHTLDSKRTGNG